MVSREGHVYNPLPTPTSIRVLLLAPGRQHDDIYCYLFPCDLDKDHAIDSSVPLPFESTYLATVTGPNDEDSTKSLVLQMDSYIDDNTEDLRASSGTQNKYKENEERINQAVPKSSSLPVESTSLPVVSTERATDHRTISSKVEQDELSETLKNSHNMPSLVLGDEIIKTVANEGQLNNEFEKSSILWHPQQLAKLAMANGALDHCIRRHPFQRYKALSYVWGSLENPEHIVLEGHTRFQVTRNLFNALKCLRRPDATLALWIDAICINQNDPEEKKAQIGMMRRVYRQAQKVIAFVPQQLEDVETFNELIKKILRAYGNCTEAVKSIARRESQDMIDSLAQTQEVELEQDEQQTCAILVSDAYGAKIKRMPVKPIGTCIEDYDLPREDDSVWSAWRQFFAAPYFRRIWILQEFVLAKDLCLHNGHSEQSYPDIALAMLAVSSMSRMINLHYLGRGDDADLTRAATLGWRGLEIMNMERTFAQGELHHETKRNLLNDTSSLISKIRLTFDFDATDPRDKIYALMGLVSDTERFQHLVSYQPTDTSPKIYQIFAKALIEQGHLVEVLHMSCRACFNLQLPSWVPDWSATFTDAKAPDISMQSGYKAGGERTSTLPRFIQDRLILSGRIFARITFMASSVRKYSLNTAFGGRIQDLFEMLTASLQELHSHSGYNPAEALKSLFYCLTMQLDTLESLDRADSKKSRLAKDLHSFTKLFLHVTAYMQIENKANYKFTPGSFPEEDLAFMQRIMGNVMGRCFCVTRPGNRFGLVPEHARTGDSLAIIQGVPVPIVLRKISESSTDDRPLYSLEGEAFIQGIMRGEIAQGENFVWSEVILSSRTNAQLDPTV